MTQGYSTVLSKSVHEEAYAGAPGSSLSFLPLPPALTRVVAAVHYTQVSVGWDICGGDKGGHLRPGRSPSH